MTLGSLAPMLQNPLIQQIVATLLFSPFAYSVDGGWEPPPIG